MLNRFDYLIAAETKGPANLSFVIHFCVAYFHPSGTNTTTGDFCDYYVNFNQMPTLG